MATLNVKIVGQTSGASNSIDNVIQKVQGELKALEKPIKIAVDAKGFEAVSKQATSLLKAQANLVKEENRLAVEREKTAQATEKRLAEEVKLSAKVKEVTEEQKKANAAAKEQAQQYQDAVRAVKEYYAALRELQKANSDVGLTKNGWESASGDWSSLADNLNRVTTAFNSLTDAENVNKLSDEQQIKLKQTMAKEAENYALQIEKAANKEASAAEQAKNTTQALSAEEMAMKSAEVVSKSYADGLGDIIAHQEKMVDGNVVEAMTKYRDEAGNVTKVVARLKDGQVQLSKTMDQASEATKKQADVAELASKKNSLLGDSLDRIFAKVSAWQLINWAVSSAIGAFREAIQTIKEVDTQLVTIRKTTDLTEQEIGQLTDRTYELAAAYGRTADELLGLTSTFARAGLHDQLDEMTELAALLENVGDIEGDTAAKFILAANAAWQLQGNYESLMEIIDGMNAVTNQAAVDMEALTTGITVAGSVFANAGETAQTYTALVGTAVAATQRSGSEVARGLRTIAMNIRSIKGELEDGEIIDEASISDAAAALHSVGISVADANGELRLTSDVLADLAGKWDELTTAEQAYLAESLAGKRQANVLTALMQNWSEVSRQMTLYAEGAGSALQENEIYLDSWEAKTEQLSAAWTNLIQGFVETRGIKDAIEGLTELINVLDKLRPIIDVIFPNRWKDAWNDLKEAIDSVESKEDKINAIIEENNQKIAENNDLISEAIALGGNQAYVETLFAENIQLQESNDKLKEQLGITEELKEAEQELNRERAIGIAQKYGIRDFSSVGATNALQELYNNPEGYDKESFLTAERELKQLVTFFETYTGVVEEASEAEKVETQSAYDAAMAQRTLAEATEESSEKVSQFTTSAETLNQNALPAFKALKAVYDEITESGHLSFATVASLSEQFKDVASIDSYITRLLNVGSTGEDVSSILTELAYQLLVNADYSKALAGSSQYLIEAMLEEAGVANSTRAAMDLLATAIATANNSELDFATQIQELKKLAIAAGVAATTVASIGHPEILKPSQMKNGMVTDAGTGGGTTVEKLMALISNQVESLVFDAPGGSGGGGGSTRSGGSYTSKAKEENKVLTAIKEQIQANKDNVAILKSQLAIMQERGDSQNEIVAKMREIQAAEHQSAEYLRENADYWEELKIDQSDVNALSLDWWKIQNDINDLLEETVDLREDELDAIQSSISLEKQKLEFLEESGKSVEEQIAQIKKIQGELHVEAEQRRANLETLKASGASASELADAEAEIVKLSTEWWEYQNKIDKLLTKQAEEAEKKRKEQIKAAKEEAIALLNAEEAAAKGPLQEQLELLQAQDDALKDEREEAEKLLAVEKAREALLNAQNERTVRQYNASMGQWEWVANASTVAKAQDDLAKAEQNLSDYYAKREIDELKDRINEINTSYDALRDSVNDFSAALEDGTAEWRDAADYIVQAAAGMGAEIQQSAIAAANIFRSTVVESGNQFRSAITGESTVSQESPYVTGTAAYREPGAKRATVNPYHPLNVISRMQSEAGGGLMTEEEMISRLEAAANSAPNNSIKRNAYQTAIDYIRDPSSYTGPNQIYAGVYDRGGILRGVGGIKATKEDEMVLPPSATKAMLDAEQNGSFNALLRHLGIITAAAESYAGFGGSTTTRIGTQNNGDTYQFGNIMLSEAQAKSMSVYDLACMAGELSLHNAM